MSWYEAKLAILQEAIRTYLNHPGTYPNCVSPKKNGAGDGIRTRNTQLGKLIRYRCVTPAFTPCTLCFSMR